MSAVLDSLLRGVRLRCPCCGIGRLFRSTFTMYEECSACGERYEREPGQWFGAVYINVGLTEAVAVTGFVLTQSLTTLSPTQQLEIWAPVAAIGPFLFFRFAKGLWTSLVFLAEGLYLAWPSR